MRNLAQLFFLLLLPILSARGQVANFTANFNEGCEPLIVHFTNTSSGASSYHWDLGNGVTSAFVNPSTSYITAGTYTVTLTAYSGASFTKKQMTIRVYTGPVIDFTAGDTVVCPKERTRFASTIISNAPGGLTYLWNFGDGTTGTTDSPTHAYTTGGFKNVSLFVTNSKGCSSLFTRSGYIYVHPPILANFTISDTQFCTTPSHAVFTNLTTGGTPPLAYAWSFGDGGTSTAISPAHDYTVQGVYTIQLAASDSFNCADTIKPSTRVTAGAHIANFYIADTACLNRAFNVSDTNSAHTATYWNFGDGSTSTGLIATHSYSVTGTYTISMVTFDGFCYDTIQHNVGVSADPVASVALSPVSPCPAPTPVTLNGSAPPNIGFKWQYDDGGTDTTRHYTRSWADNGLHIFTMTATSNWGCISRKVDTFTQYAILPQLASTGLGGCIPHNVGFVLSVASLVYHPVSGMTTYPYLPLSSYTWRFGDGSAPSSAASPSHTYTAIGVYTVTVSAITANGCPVRDTTIAMAGVPRSATFTIAPTRVCARHNVSFTATASGSVSEFTWRFGDGFGEPGGAFAIHTYTVPGTYNATVTPTYYGCIGTPYTSPVNIVIDAPLSRFSATYPCDPPYTDITFTNLSVGATSSRWWFGDGASTTVTSPAHSYPSLGSYPVTLATHNAITGCRDTLTEMVDIYHLVPTFTADDSTVCRDAIVALSSTTTGPVYGFAWYVDTKADSFRSARIDTFFVTGRYSVMLVTTDSHGCLDTAIKNNYIHVARPVASFNASVTSGCLPLTTAFTDASTDLPGVTLTNFEWHFGDLATASSPSPSTTHTYLDPGSYTVTEIVTDSMGCRDTLSKSDYIVTSNTDATFSASATHACAGEAITFYRHYAGTTGSSWSFGDGGTSTDPSPVHVYTAAGIYTVKHIVVDPSTCTDTVEMPDLITVTFPHASFTMNDTLAVCPPLSASFTNTSTGASTYFWDFGDGNSSTLHSPGNVYTMPGYFEIALTAADSWGCIDIATAHARVFGMIGDFVNTPVTGCAPLTVNFTAGLSDAVAIVWDFADGSTSPPSLSLTATHTYSVQGVYLPKLLLTDSTGCQTASPGKDTIKVNFINAGFTMTPEHLCVGSSFTCVDTTNNFLSATSVRGWTFDDDTSSESTHSFTADTPGVYSVTLNLIDQWGCNGIVTKDVSIYSLYDAGFIMGDTELCQGASIILSDSVTGGQWSITPSAVATLEPVDAGVVRLTGWLPGAGTLRYIAGNGFCSDTATKRIRVNIQPDAGSISGQPQVCKGAVFQLSNAATGGHWISSSANIEIIDTITATVKAVSAGTVIISYTKDANASGCTNAAYFTILITDGPQFTVDSSVSPPICYGDTDGSIAVSVGNTLPPVAYSWSNGATTESLTNLGAGEYILTIRETPTQCLLTATFTITQPDSFTLTPRITDDHCMKNEGAIYMHAGGGTRPYTYAWNNSTTTAAELANLRSGDYVFIITDSNNCTKTTTITVHDDTCHLVQIPDVITPNGDGYNDQWMIKGLDIYPQASVQVFNKWGDMLFERNGYNNDWTGQGKNGPIPDGTYYYILKLNAPNIHGGADTYTGSILIKR